MVQSGALGTLTTEGAGFSAVLPACISVTCMNSGASCACQTQPPDGNGLGAPGEALGREVVLNLMRTPPALAFVHSVLWPGDPGECGEHTYREAEGSFFCKSYCSLV